MKISDEEKRKAEEYKAEILGNMKDADMVAGILVKGEGHVHSFCVGVGSDAKTLIMIIQSLREVADEIAEEVLTTLDKIGLSETEVQKLFDAIKKDTKSETKHHESRTEIYGEDDE